MTHRRINDCVYRLASGDAGQLRQYLDRAHGFTHTTP